MDFVQHDHVVQAFAADGADDSFSVGILPGRSRRSGDFVGSYAFDARGVKLFGRTSTSDDYWICDS